MQTMFNYIKFMLEVCMSKMSKKVTKGVKIDIATNHHNKLILAL